MYWPYRKQRPFFDGQAIMSLTFFRGGGGSLLCGKKIGDAADSYAVRKKSSIFK